MNEQDKARMVMRKTLASFENVIFSDSVIDGLIARMKTYDAKNPLSLAHVIARNWAMSQKRRVDAAEKDARHKMIKDMEDEQAARLESHVQAEWLRVRQIVLPKIIPSRASAFLYFEHICFKNVSDKQIAHQFPGTTSAQRYQWLARVRKTVLPHCTDDALKSRIQSRMRTKEDSSEASLPNTCSAIYPRRDRVIVLSQMDSKRRQP